MDTNPWHHCSHGGGHPGRSGGGGQRVRKPTTDQPATGTAGVPRRAETASSLLLGPESRYWRRQLGALAWVRAGGTRPRRPHRPPRLGRPVGGERHRFRHRDHQGHRRACASQRSARPVWPLSTESPTPTVGAAPATGSACPTGYATQRSKHSKRRPPSEGSRRRPPGSTSGSLSQDSRQSGMSGPQGRLRPATPGGTAQQSAPFWHASGVRLTAQPVRSSFDGVRGGSAVTDVDKISRCTRGTTLRHGLPSTRRRSTRREGIS